MYFKGEIWSVHVFAKCRSIIRVFNLCALTPDDLWPLLACFEPPLTNNVLSLVPKSKNHAKIHRQENGSDETLKKKKHPQHKHKSQTYKTSPLKQAIYNNGMFRWFLKEFRVVSDFRITRIHLKTIPYTIIREHALKKHIAQQRIKYSLIRPVEISLMCVFAGKLRLQHTSLGLGFKALYLTRKQSSASDSCSLVLHLLF